MTDFTEVIEGILRRGDVVSPQLPNANWIGLSGNFTPTELRAIADQIEAQTKRGINVNHS